jgi:hypothetical protein
MATARDVLKRALRLIQAKAAGEEPTADEGQDGLTTLNRMLHGFPAQGIEYVHATIDNLTDELNVPDEHLESIEYLLAMRLAPDYEREASKDVMDMAENAKRYLQGAYVKVPTVGVDSGLQDMPSQGVNSGWESISNG